MPEHLSNHHREILAEIHDHQRGGNVEWRKIVRAEIYASPAAALAAHSSR